MTEERVQRRLAAILIADVVGYSRLMEADEEGTRSRLRALHAEIIDPNVAADGGRVVKTSGDGTLVEFPSAVDAVRNAVRTQKAIIAANLDMPEDRRIIYRVGINVGDVMVEGDDLFGDGVNVAARLEGLCAPGAVYISGTVYDQVRDKLDIAFEDLGEQRVKNIANPVRVYRADDAPVARERRSSAVQPTSTVATAGPSVIVLPFDNLSNDPEQEYFADGIAEDLMTDLSKLSGLFVISRNIAFTYKGKAIEVSEIGRRHRVGHLLEGSVRRVGNRVRINAQLIDIATGGHVWADRYDGALDDIFALQDEITEKIVAALEVQLTPQEAAHTRDRVTDSVEAYELFLQARAQWYRLDPPGTSEAVRLLREAISIDPNFSVAYALLTGALQHGWTFGFPGFENGREEMMDAAERAVATDDHSAIAHARLGWAFIFFGRYEEAVSTFERAVELGPYDAETHMWFNEALNYAGDPARGAERAERGFELQLDADGLHYLCAGHSQYLLRNYEQAIEFLSESSARIPGFPLPYLLIGVVYYEMGRLNDAKIAFTKLHETLPPKVLDGIVGRLPYRDEESRQRMREAIEQAGTSN